MIYKVEEDIYILDIGYNKIYIYNIYMIYDIK